MRSLSSRSFSFKEDGLQQPYECIRVLNKNSAIPFFSLHCGGFFCLSYLLLFSFFRLFGEPTDPFQPVEGMDNLAS